MKRFLSKFLLFILMITLAQAGISNVHKMPKNIKKLHTITGDHRNIIFLGDSTVYWSSAGEGEQLRIPEMLQEMLPRYRVTELTHAAYTMDIFSEYCDYFVRNNVPVSLVIIPINMRSFSPQWDMNPGYQFDEEKLLLKYNFLVRLFQKPLAVFKLFKPRITNSDYKNAPVFDGDTRVGTVIDFDSPRYETYSDRHMRNKIIFQYMYLLKKDHRKIISMLRIARLSDGQKIVPLFYFTPIDYRTGDRFLGERFSARLKENAGVIKQLLRDHGIEAVDLSMSLGPEGFDWANLRYPNEHLSETGKRFVAERIGEAIKDRVLPGRNGE